MPATGKTILENPVLAQSLANDLAEGMSIRTAVATYGYCDQAIQAAKPLLPQPSTTWKDKAIKVIEATTEYALDRYQQDLRSGKRPVNIVEYGILIDKRAVLLSEQQALPSGQQAVDTISTVLAELRSLRPQINVQVNVVTGGGGTASKGVEKC